MGSPGRKGGPGRNHMRFAYREAYPYFVKPPKEGSTNRLAKRGDAASGF